MEIKREKEKKRGPRRELNLFSCRFVKSHHTHDTHMTHTLKNTSVQPQKITAKSYNNRPYTNKVSGLANMRQRLGLAWWRRWCWREETPSSPSPLFYDLKVYIEYWVEQYTCHKMFYDGNIMYSKFLFLSRCFSCVFIALKQQYIW